MEEITVNGLNIAFQRKGQGPPLVLLHGAMVDSRYWHPQIDALSDEFTVVAWDAPGCGRSDDPPENLSLADYADVLAEWIAALGFGQAHILGLSFGSGLAIEFYHRYPHIPKTLILASAYAGWAGSLPPEAVNERLKSGLELSKKSPELVIEAFLPTLFVESASSRVKEEMAEYISNFHPVGMRAMLRAFAEADLRDVLPAIQVPTLLLYGEDDKRSPMEVAEKLHAQIPTSKLVILPGTGHVSSLKTPEAFNEEVRSFLRSNQS